MKLIPFKPPYATDYDYSRLHQWAESGRVLQFKSSSFRPLRSNEAADVKGKADGGTKAQLMTGTIGVTQSPWDVPNRPSYLPSSSYKFTRKPYRNGPGPLASMILIVRKLWRGM